MGIHVNVCSWYLCPTPSGTSGNQHRNSLEQYGVHRGHGKTCMCTVPDTGHKQGPWVLTWESREQSSVLRSQEEETCTGPDATLPTGPGGCPTKEFPFSGAKWPKVYMGIWVRSRMGYRQCQSMSYLLWDPDMLLTYHPPSTSEEPTDVHPGASLKYPKTMHQEQCPGS